MTIIDRTESSKRRKMTFVNYNKVALSLMMVLLLLFHQAHAVPSPSSHTTIQKHNKIIPATTSSETPVMASIFSDIPATKAIMRGGGDAKNSVVSSSGVPSFYWAVLHNWLYFLSLGFNLLNIPYMIREIVEGDAKISSPQSIALSGNVEAVDKILTFCGVAFLSMLSDRHGRKPLIAWSAFGFCITNLIQAFAGRAGGTTTTTAKALLYLADIVDGCSSCMNPVCQAYVADCAAAAGDGSLATKLGIFQGISTGGAFIIAFPIGGILGAKFGPRLPILMAAGFQLLNGLLAIFVTPESNAIAKAKINNGVKTTINLSEINPITGLKKLLGIGKTDSPGFGTKSVGLLRMASIAYFLICIARGSLDAQFVNYTNIRFGWTQAQSGPVLVMVGLMLAIVPRIMVPLLGLEKSINYGLLVYIVGMASAGLVSTASHFVFAIALIAFGSVAFPALQALLANLVPPNQSGALLGAVGSVQELTGAISSTMYASLLATFATDAVPNNSKLLSSLKSALPAWPGMHFIFGATFALISWIVSSQGLSRAGVNKSATKLD